MQLIDRWTTQDGSWDVDITKPYGIDLIHRVNYGAEASQLGGANHIYVSVPKGIHKLEFNTEDGMNPWQTNIMLDRPTWYNYPLFHSSAYNPDNGEIGPWKVLVDNELIASGIGLPYGWHVSTFLVVGEGEAVPVPQPPSPGQDRIRVYRNDDLEYDSHPPTFGVNKRGLLRELGFTEKQLDGVVFDSEG